MIRQLFHKIKCLMGLGLGGKRSSPVIEREGHGTSDRAVTKFHKGNLLAAQMAMPTAPRRRSGAHRKPGRRGRVIQQRANARKLAQLSYVAPPQEGHRRPEFSSPIPDKWFSVSAVEAL